MGEEYVAASGHTITNTGQQVVHSYTDEFMPVQSKYQRTQVHRPLCAVSDLEDNDKTLVISKKYGKFIMCDLTGVRAQIDREDGTYHMKHWVYKGNQGFMGHA